MQLRAVFERATENGLEGIMVKHPETRYLLGDRSSGWQKIKPEYVEGAMDTVDLAIIGACYSLGRSAGRRGLSGLTHFILGCRVERKGEPLRLAPCGRVGTGYSFAELRRLQERILPIMVRRNISKRGGAQGCTDLPTEVFGHSSFSADH